MSAALALAASVLWGGSDFMGGTASRRLSPLAVIVWSDGFVVIPLLALGLGLGQFHVDAALVGWGCGAGLVGMVGVVAFYRALADGAMGVVAPIAGLGVVVPVVVGITIGNHPDVAQVAGMGVGIVGVVLVSSGGVGPNTGVRVLALAAVAGAAFGTCFVFIDRSEPQGTLMTLLMMRLAVLSVLGTTALVRRSGLAMPVREWPLIGAIGALDVLANGCFAAATSLGQLAVVSVLSSLYPAVTAILARAVHDERLSRRQLAGVIAAMAAIGLLASGPGG